MSLKSFICATLLSLGTMSQAQDAKTTDAIHTAWQDWAAQNNIDGTTIAIGFDSEILASYGKARDPAKPYPLASLSKAITAVCLHNVMVEQGIPLDTPLGQLSETFTAKNITIPPRLADVSLGAVITMSSGMSPDITQRQFMRNRAFGDTRNIGFARRAIANNALKGSQGEYFYNNGNYALLGALLEGLTGTDNITACRDRVFPPAHRTTPSFNSDWIALAAFGGWEASATDYLAFVMQAFAPDGDITKNLLRLPFQDVGRGAKYGLGTFFRLNGQRSIFWHAGAICVNSRTLDQGSYFAYYENGYAVTVTYNVCGVGDVGRNLDTAMWNAANISE